MKPEIKISDEERKSIKLDIIRHIGQYHCKNAIERVCKGCKTVIRPKTTIMRINRNGVCKVFCKKCHKILSVNEIAGENPSEINLGHMYR